MEYARRIPSGLYKGRRVRPDRATTPLFASLPLGLCRTAPHSGSRGAARIAAYSNSDTIPTPSVDAERRTDYTRASAPHEPGPACMTRTAITNDQTRARRNPTRFRKGATTDHGCSEAACLARPTGRASQPPRDRPAAAGRMSPLPRAQAAASRLPELRLLRWPPGDRHQAADRRANVVVARVICPAQPDRPWI
jgi:hypothetical protein